MELATEATNAQGNAMANQQKYMDSLAGKVQSLKTEMSVLWMSLLDSDDIAEMIDSVKELIVSLQDSATGLKPVVSLLADILKYISKILSVIPAGGLIASILGLKYGKSIASVITKFTGLVSIAGASFNRMLNTTKAIIASNPLGALAVGITTIITLFNVFHKSVSELQQDFEEQNETVQKTKTELDSLNESLETQLGIIRELTGKHISYFDNQELANAQKMTAQLQLQKKEAEDRLRIERKSAIETKLKEWGKKDFGYLHYIPGSDPNSYNIDDVILSYNELGDQLQEVSEYYDDLKGKTDLSSTESSFVNEYEKLTRLHNKMERFLYPTEYNNLELSKIINTDDVKIQSQINQLISSIDISKPFYIDAIRQKLTEPMYENLNKAIADSDFVENGEGDAVAVFARWLYGAAEEAAETPPKKKVKISLADWYTLDSDIDSSKKWKDVTDSLFEGLDKIGEFVKTNRSAGERLLGLDVFEATGVDETIFKKLGIGSLNSYLEQHKEDPQIAFDEYVKDVVTAFLNAVGDTESINGFDLILEKLGIKSIQARGGAYDEDIENAINAYKKIYSVYQKSKNGGLFSGEEVSQLEQEYGSLADQLTVVGDKYKINSDALRDLVNQYVDSANKQIAAQIDTTRQYIDSLRERSEALKKYAKEDLKTQIEMTKNEIGQIKTRIKALEIEMKDYDPLNKIYLLEDDISPERQLNKLKGDKSILEEALVELENLLGLEDALKESTKHKNDTAKDTGSEIDWIANSLNNLSTAADKAQAAYDRLLTTAGNVDALKKANDYLTTSIDALSELEAGYERATKEYQAEFDALGLTDEQKELIKNKVVSGGIDEAWSIEEYDQETAELLNNGTNLFKNIVDSSEKALDTHAKKLEQQIQRLQNVSEFYSKSVSEYEAKLNVETDVKKQQSYVRQMIEYTKDQYYADIAIALQKDDQLEALRLIAEAQQKVNELTAQETQLAIDNTTTYFDRLLSEYENRQAILEHGITMAEGRGHLASKNYYAVLIDNEITTLEESLKERDELIEELATIDTSSKEGLEQWWTTKQAIDGVTNSIYESEEAVQSWQKAIEDLDYQVFERIQTAISGINEEAEFLANLFRNEDLFQYVEDLVDASGNLMKIYQGGYSKAGMSMLGLHALELKTNTELAENYAKELEKVNAKLASDPADVEALDKRNELLNLQRESINAAEAEKDAILDLVREGYDKQLESMQKLSDEYVKALRAEKD